MEGVAYSDGSKSGGRKAGTPNKPTQFRKFLDGVFTQAMEDPGFRAELLLQITTLKIDTKVLLRLLEYWIGAPPKPKLQVKHEVDLAKLIAGVVDEARGDDGDELDEAA
jgi:hypothetical protein